MTEVGERESEIERRRGRKQPRENEKKERPKGRERKTKRETARKIERARPLTIREMHPILKAIRIPTKPREKHGRHDKIKRPIPRRSDSAHPHRAPNAPRTRRRRRQLLADIIDEQIEGAAHEPGDVDPELLDARGELEADEVDCVEEDGVRGVGVPDGEGERGLEEREGLVEVELEDVLEEYGEAGSISVRIRFDCWLIGSSGTIG